MKRTLSFLFMLSGLLLWAAPAVSSPQNSPDRLRVSVIDNKDKIYLIVKGPYKIIAADSDRVVMEGARLRAYVKAAEGGIAVGLKDMKLQALRVRPFKDSTVYVDWRRLRGDVDIARKDDLKLTVINNIEMEDYLYGVLYHEVSHKWPMEVLKAQAIAARTFALQQKMNSALQPYDLRSDIYSQVYGGASSEKWATTKAVNLTKGKVLVYNGAIFPAYYHATCAGFTEDASNLWNIDLAPLKGVACGFCKRSPHYRWTKEVSLWELRTKLKNKGYQIGGIVSVNIISPNPSGRVEKVEIKDDAAVSVILTAKDFRQILGPNDMKSTKFDCSIRWNKLVLKGSGWGHGVGMCQWGAYGMARKGKKAEEILQYYYPGAEITTIDKLKAAA